MSAIIIYPASDNRQSQPVSLKLDEQVFFLHWSESGRNETDPLKIQPVYCRQPAVSFSHLAVPLLFIEDSHDSGHYSTVGSLLKSDSSAKILKDLNSSQPIGLLLLQNPGIIQIGSYADFRIWFDKMAASLSSTLLLQS